MSALARRRCAPVPPGTPPLAEARVRELLAALPAWTVEGGALVRRYEFRDHYETMAFVNALAWISHREDHHPDLEVGYRHCRLAYRTHSVGGLTENDFICAAKCDALLEG